jgi:anti-sigma factor RsiW
MKHLTVEQLGQYRDRTMPAAELLAFDLHIALCEECREQLAGKAKAAKLVSGLIAAASSPEHLSYDQMADYVDGKASDLDGEVVESHAELCSQCAAELEDLVSFARTLAEAKAAEPAPLASETRGLGAISFSKKDARIKIPAQEKGNKGQ